MSTISWRGDSVSGLCRHHSRVFVFTRLKLSLTFVELRFYVFVLSSSPRDCIRYKLVIFLIQKFYIF